MINIKNTGIYFTDPKNTKGVVRLTIKNKIGPYYEPSIGFAIIPLSVSDVAELYPNALMAEAVTLTKTLLKIQFKSEFFNVTQSVDTVYDLDSAIFQSIASIFERNEIIEMLHVAYHTAWERLNGCAQLPEYVQG